MTLRPYESGDLKLINTWLHKRGLTPVTNQEIPAFGLIAFGGGEPVGAGFIRHGEGIAILDSVVTNPDCKGSFRDEALDLLFSELIAHAASQGIKKVIGFSVDKNTLSRAERHGFVRPIHTLMALSIGG